MIKRFLLLASMAFSLASSAKELDLNNFQISDLDNRATEDYVERYKFIAMTEMNKTGIPASVKLAQGILESNSGRGRLSIEANNHFGIKCHSSWAGESYYAKDDDFVNGKLVKSCFRKYPTDIDSYRDHSDFLTTIGRYKTLFSFGKQDYWSWCRGLKQTGYATARTYDASLISIIEQFSLWKFDQQGALDMPMMNDLASGNNKIDLPINTIDIVSAEVEQPIIIAFSSTVNQSNLGGASSLRKSLYRNSDAGLGITKVNDLKAYKLAPGDNLETIAEATGVGQRKLRKFNELFDEEEVHIATYVYLEHKQDEVTSTARRTHVVREGECLWDIAHQYGVSVKCLRKLNDIAKKQEPLAGQILNLKEKVATPIATCEPSFKLKELENFQNKINNQVITNNKQATVGVQ